MSCSPFALILIRRKHPLGLLLMRLLPPFRRRSKLCSDLCGHSFGHFFGQVASGSTCAAPDASLEICITTRRKTKQLATVWRPGSSEEMDLAMGMGTGSGVAQRLLCCVSVTNCNRIWRGLCLGRAPDFPRPQTPGFIIINFVMGRRERSICSW